MVFILLINTCSKSAFFRISHGPILRDYRDDISFLEHPLPTNVYTTSQLYFLVINLGHYWAYLVHNITLFYHYLRIPLYVR